MTAYDGYHHRRRVKQVIENQQREIIDILNAHEVRAAGHNGLKGVYRTNITVREGRAADEYGEDYEESQDVWILNPPEYSADYNEYINRLLGHEIIALFVATNPAPSSLTGIPFYRSETFALLLGAHLVPDKICQWIGTVADINSDSGARFWKLMDMCFDRRPEFFDLCFIIDFCPLIFVTETTNGNIRNISLKDLDPENDYLLRDLWNACDRALQKIIMCLAPDLIVEVGRYAHDRVNDALRVRSVRDAVGDVEVIGIEHPGYPGYRSRSYPGILKDRVRQWKSKAHYNLTQNEVWTTRVSTREKHFLYRHRFKQVAETHRREIIGILNAHGVSAAGHTGLKGVYPTNITIGGGAADEIVWILNPLEYTADYDEYINRLLGEEVVTLFVAMNPAPRSLTGIPFYRRETFQPLLGDPLVPDEIRQWIGNDGDVDSDSGERFWQLMDKCFARRQEFFDRCFIINFCPLIFVSETYTNGNIRNISLENLDPENNSLLRDLWNACDRALQKIITGLTPDLIVEVGGYAHDRVTDALRIQSVRDAVGDVETIQIQHPGHPGYADPGSDAVRRWKSKAYDKLKQNEIWAICL